MAYQFAASHVFWPTGASSSTGAALASGWLKIIKPEGIHGSTMKTVDEPSNMRTFHWYIANRRGFKSLSFHFFSVLNPGDIWYWGGISDWRCEWPLSGGPVFFQRFNVGHTTQWTFGCKLHPFWILHQNVNLFVCFETLNRNQMEWPVPHKNWMTPIKNMNIRVNQTASRATSGDDLFSAPRALQFAHCPGHAAPSLPSRRLRLVVDSCVRDPWSI